jgi:hypothetical protein
MGRASTPTEILYYGSTRQEQYWENEAETLRIARDISSPMWLAYRKQSGSYQPFPVKPSPVGTKKRSRKKEAENLPLKGRSAEEVVENLKKNHRLLIFLEQRLRRWMNKSSGDRVLAFLDPNQGGAPVMDDPGIPHSQQPQLPKRD